MQGLTCPRCDKQLNKQADDSIVCKACGVSFPTLNATVPFIWSEPGSSLRDWRNRYNATLADIETQIVDAATTPSTATPATQRRIAHLHSAWKQHLAELQALLAPLNVGEALAKETHLALRTNLPSHHGVLSYAQNIHRDWCWGDDENQAVIRHLVDALASAGEKPNNQIDNILVLGCGAGRLAYDLHRALQPSHTWALDSNPLLCLIADRMCAGQAMQFTEFPLAPISLEDSARERSLSAPVAISDIEFVCADAMRAPFANGQFDLVVTPWLIDVVDASLSESLTNIHRLLKPGGTWLNHGSVAFPGAQAKNRLTTEEVAEISTANGFQVVFQADIELPYLASPASRQTRRELVHTQIAERNQAEYTKLERKHQHLPDWIVAGRTPVPLTPGFQSQITSTRIHAFIMSLIDGKRTVRDMAKLMEDQRLMPVEQAIPAISQFLTTMYEEETRAQGRAGM